MLLFFFCQSSSEQHDCRPQGVTLHICLFHPFIFTHLEFVTFVISDSPFISVCHVAFHCRCNSESFQCENVIILIFFCDSCWVKSEKDKPSKVSLFVRFSTVKSADEQVIFHTVRLGSALLYKKRSTRRRGCRCGCSCPCVSPWMPAQGLRIAQKSNCGVIGTACPMQPVSHTWRLSSEHPHCHTAF